MNEKPYYDSELVRLAVNRAVKAGLLHYGHDINMYSSNYGYWVKKGNTEEAERCRNAIVKLIEAMNEEIKKQETSGKQTT